MKTAAYIRVSTTAQTGPDAFGLQAQRDAVQAYADKNDMGVVCWYSDEGVSGADMARPGLAEMLSDAVAGMFDTVLIPKLDRLARDLFGQMFVERELVKANVALISVSEPFGNDDPQSVLMRQMLGAFSEFEKSLIALRLSGGRRVKAKQGGYAGGRPSIGYMANEKQLSVDDTGSRAVQLVFSIKSQKPNLPLQKVADALNAEGFTTATGGAFGRMAVKRILDRKDFYEGAYQYAGIHSDGQHAAIL